MRRLIPQRRRQIRMQTATSFTDQLSYAVEGVEKAVLVSTFMRSGTHLTIDFIRKNFPVFRKSKKVFQSSSNLYFVLDTLQDKWGGHERYRSQFIEFLERTKNPVFKAHFLDPQLEVLNGFSPLKGLLNEKCKMVYVTRNLFKVLPSLWSFFETAKIQNPHFSEDYSSQTEFVETYAARWAEHVDTWTSKPEALHLRFEDIITDPDSVASRLASHFDEPVPESTGKDLLPPKNNSTFYHRIVNYVHPNPLSTEIRPHDKAAKEKLSLTAEEKQMCIEVAGPSLEKLGYLATA